MNGLGRIFTDPASVNHETDWGFRDWAGATGYSIAATLLVIAACVAVIGVARGFVRLEIPFGALATAALGSVGIPVLMHAVHGMARHTAGMGWVLVLVVAVYGVSFAAVWQIGPRLAQGLLEPEGRDEDRETWWKRQLFAVGALYVVAAAYNVTVEGLNKLSGGSGLAISMIVFLGVCVMGWFCVEAFRSADSR